ncbi:MAG: 50S ribosomal protein L28 [Acidobacteriia bacterium]|nr:50S ribosomal protein L28 [Terriglobia bacterium]
MALACELCGKKPHYGNTISHAHNVTRRRWNPNLRRVKAVVKGTHKRLRVCTACIRAGALRCPARGRGRGICGSSHRRGEARPHFIKPVQVILLAPRHEGFELKG